MTVQMGITLVLSYAPEKPFRNWPPGKMRIRHRNGDIMRVYVRNKQTTTAYAVKEEGGFWVPAFRLGMNKKI
jgi:hypothetical protein